MINKNKSKKLVKCDIGFAINFFTHLTCDGATLLIGDDFQCDNTICVFL